MRLGRFIAIALLIAIAALAIAVWRDPYAVVRAEYARLRIAAGLSAHEVEAGGYRWRYVERDADRNGAPTLVLVHGYTGSKENWYRLAEALGRRYRLVIPDLPGWGDSQRKPGADYGYAAQAANLAAFIDKVADGPVVLIGHSMGGGVVAVAAARYPDDVSRVGLLDASGVRFKDNAFGADVLAGKNPFGVTDQASLKAYLDILFNDEDPWVRGAARVMRAHASLNAGQLHEEAEDDFRVALAAFREAGDQAAWMAPVMRPVISSGEVLAVALSATLLPRRSTTIRSDTANTSGMRWLISATAMP
mgnify:CR=1 FL=1